MCGPVRLLRRLCMRRLLRVRLVFMPLLLRLGVLLRWVRFTVLPLIFVTSLFDFPRLGLLLLFRLVPLWGVRRLIVCRGWCRWRRRLCLLVTM